MERSRRAWIGLLLGLCAQGGCAPEGPAVPAALDAGRASPPPPAAPPPPALLPGPLTAGAGAARAVGERAVEGDPLEAALAPHRAERYQGDLPELRARGVLRVAMLNNALAYFIYRGQEVGFQYELAELLCLQLKVRLEVVVPRRSSELLGLVREGVADLAFATRREGALEGGGLLWSQPVDRADHVLVQPAGEAPLTRPEQLAGRTVHVRRSSVYFETLQGLRATQPGLGLVEASESLGTEDLVRQVGRGEIPLTVANSALLGVERSYQDDVQGSLVLGQGFPLALAARAGSPRLGAAVARFLERELAGRRFAELKARYFSPRPRMREVRLQALAATGAISPYDELVKAVAAEHGFDWRLILAQMYQESGFDPRARSWAGARGLLQVMPRTARELGLRDPWEPEQNIRAGVAYLARLRERFEPSLPVRQRLRFALASYNAGLEHVRDARRLARALKLDPDRWFGNVERAIELLEKPKFYRQARHGYCRGSEPVAYVSRIQTKYDAYSALAPAGGTR